MNEEVTAELVAAAEKHAEAYEGDPRQDIKTDVMNAYLAGAWFERERCAKVCEALMDPQDEDDGRDFCLRECAATIRGIT